MPEKAQELAEFLRERMASWEYYTWTEDIEVLDGSKATIWEMFFYLHTGNGLYRCIRPERERIPGVIWPSWSGPFG